MIIKVESSNKLLASADNLYLTGLQPIINQNDATNISSAIKNSIPAPDKRDSIRKELSNGFKYEINFSPSIDSWTINFNEKGIIDISHTENIQTIAYQLNETTITLPTNVVVGDSLDVIITKTDTQLPAQAIIKADEYTDIQNVVNTGLSPNLIDGLTCWIDYDTNVTLNYVAEIGDLKTIVGSNIIQADPGGTSPNFTDDFINRKIKLLLSSGNEYRRISAVNSSSEIEVDQNLPSTESMVQFECARVAQVDNQSTFGGNFSQTDLSKQPYYLENHQNGHNALQMINFHFLTADRFFGYESTIILVAQSTDTRSTQMNSLLCGDYDGIGGFWMTEWANPSPVGTYIGFLGSSGSSVVTSDNIRDRFHILVGQMKENHSFRARKNGVTIYNALSSSIFRGTTKLFQIGARGDNAVPGKNNQLELLYFNRFLTIQELELLEYYLKNKYNL